MTITRFGVRTPRGFLSNIVIVLVGNANALAMMQLIHHALKDLATPLSIDDSDAKSPAYFFDVTLTGTSTIVASIFGVKGMANAHLPALLASAHALVVASDASGPDPQTAARTLAAKMPKERSEEVYVLRIADSEQARAAIVAVMEDLVSKPSA
jgi:hypothetical protein